MLMEEIVLTIGIDKHLKSLSFFDDDNEVATEGGSLLDCQ